MSTPNFVVAPPQAPASLAALIAQHHALVRAEAIDNPAATLCRAEFAGFSQSFFEGDSGLNIEGKTKTFFGGQAKWGSHIISAKGTNGFGGMGRGEEDAGGVDGEVVSPLDRSGAARLGKASLH